VTDYDSPWKEALDSYFELCLAFFFPQAHTDIDWARGYQMLGKELQQIAPDAEHGRRVVDKLVKVWLKSGEERWLLIHIEVQTWREGEFPRRMYVYNYRIFDRHNREVISLAILADEEASWRPDHYGYGRWGFRTEIRFPVVKLLDYAPHWQALEVDPNPFAVVVLAHLKTLETRHAPADRHTWKVRLVKGLYERGMEAEHVRRLFRFIDWVIDLPPALDRMFWQEIHEYQEEKRMPFITTPERLGRIDGFLEALEPYLEEKLGAAGLQLMPEIRQITDIEVLRAVLQALKKGAGPDELRRIWAP
jgi:hypothetical protein